MSLEGIEAAAKISGTDAKDADKTQIVQLLYEKPLMLPNVSVMQDDTIETWD